MMKNVASKNNSAIPFAIRGYTFTQELVPKGTIKNLPIFTQELHYGNYLPTYICLFLHRNYKIVTGY